MSIRIFLKNVKIFENVKISLTKNHLHYLKNVMRLPNGANIKIFNERYGEWDAEFQNSSVLPFNKIKSAFLSKSVLNLCFAIPKMQALKNIVRQTTELGVDVLQPIYTKYTVGKINNLEKLELWAREAIEQCGRLSLPIIKKPINFFELQSQYKNLFMCDTLFKVEQEKEERLDKNNYTVLVGPEGGFCKEEREINCKKVSLGQNILRCDTACSAAVFYFKSRLGPSLA